MFSKSRDRRRHQQLMAVADTLIGNQILDSASPHEVTPDHVVALAFGRLQLRIDAGEAAQYLSAALIERNYSFDHLSPTVGKDTSYGAGSE